MLVPSLQPSEKALLLGIQDKSNTAVHAELLKDIVEMGLDRSLREREAIRNLRVSQPLCHAPHDLELPGRQYQSSFPGR